MVPNMQVSTHLDRMPSRPDDLQRNDPEVKRKRGGRAGWYTGGNSTCRRHIVSSHYEEYTKRCAEAKLKEAQAASGGDENERKGEK